MDILIDRHIPLAELLEFLAPYCGSKRPFLLPAGLATGWNAAPPNACLFQFTANEAVSGVFKYGLSVFVASHDIEALLENMACALAATFNCATLFDASRFLQKPAPYRSLMFTDGKVFLVDDFGLEETGSVTKIQEVAYERPLLR